MHCRVQRYGSILNRTDFFKPAVEKNVLVCVWGGGGGRRNGTKREGEEERVGGGSVAARQFDPHVEIIL